MKISFGRMAVGLSAVSSATATVIACSSDPIEQVQKTDAPPAPARGESGAGDGEHFVVDAAKQKPPFDPKDEPVNCSATPCAIQIVAGENHFCTRMSDGTVRCWGDNTAGSLGVDDAGIGADPSGMDGSDTGGWRATRVADLEGATQISAGGTTTCAVVGDGGVYCWGGNDYGQLGVDGVAAVVDTEGHPNPTRVALNAEAKRVDVGPRSACALVASGAVWCWGDNSQEQLARTPALAAAVPGKAGLGNFDIAYTKAGTFTGFAVSVTGELVSWGALGGPEGSASGRTSSLFRDAVPSAIELGSVTSLSVSSTTILTGVYSLGGPITTRGIGHACAIAKGEVFCWGDSLMGAIGAGVPELVQEPRHAVVGSDTAWPQQVAAGNEFTCVRLTDGTVECTGDNAFGVLGRDPKSIFSLVLKPAETFKDHAVQIAAASRTVCAVIQGGGVMCWGSNERNELGQGRIDNDAHHIPVSVRF